jgi:F-type H+-transporting ATPase subunit a
MNSPLESAILFQIGPVPITQAIVTTWVIMAGAGAWRILSDPADRNGPRQTPGGA